MMSPGNQLFHRAVLISRISSNHDLGNRSSILLSYRVVEHSLYASWHYSASEICTICTHFHMNAPIHTSTRREKHGKTSSEIALQKEGLSLPLDPSIKSQIGFFINCTNDEKSNGKAVH